MQLHWKQIAAAGLLAWGLALAPAGAEEAEVPPPPPAVPLEDLLRVPASVETASPRYGGATRKEWQARFAKAQSDLEAAQTALNEAQEELGSLAAKTSQWQMAAPGLGGLQAASGENGPLNYRLHQEIRRQREEVERSERRIQELRVEANLAGVPREWFESEASGAPAVAEDDSGASGDPAPSPWQEGEGG